MKKRQGKTCPIDTTGRVLSYHGSHQQQAIDVTCQTLLLLFNRKAKATSREESTQRTMLIDWLVVLAFGEEGAGSWCVTSITYCR